MTLLDAARLPVMPGINGLPTAAARILMEVRGGGEQGSVVVVQGPGGSGKTHLLMALDTAYRDAGLAVANARSWLERPEPCESVVLIVDDVHLLGPPVLHGLRRALDHPQIRAVLALRPWPRPPALADLLRDIGQRRRTVVLDHADGQTVAAWAEDYLGHAAPPALVAAVHRQTGGLPSLVHPLLQSATHRLRGRGTRPPEPGGAAALDVPADLVERIRGDLLAVDDRVHRLLCAVAAGAPVDVRVLTQLLAVSEREAGDTVSDALASGILLTNGGVVPIVARILLTGMPADVVAGIRRRVFGLLLQSGAEPVGLASLLAATGVREPAAAELLERHGTAALADDPARAARLLADATACGVPAARTAARRAQALALCGDFDSALQWADVVLEDDRSPDRPRAGAVAAAVLASRGLLIRSAKLYQLAGRERAGSAALALVATGAADEAAAVLDDAARAPDRGPATMLAGSEELMAKGVLRSLRHGPSTSDDITTALSSLTRAAALLEPVGRTALLVDSPAALAALVALHSGELSVAESVLRRALASDLGGPSLRSRHLLLLAWVAMLRGQTSVARAHLAEATEGSGPLEPRDDLFLQALEVGLARRSSDLPALVQAWVRAREAVVRYPIDLFVLLPLGELVVAGARLEDAERLAPHVAEAERILAALDDPQLWAAPLHWSGAQAAILTDSPGALEPHARALVSAARTSPYAATLAQAGRSWLRVLRNDVEAASVVHAAEQLAGVGLAWDGSRLAGQAAARARDSHDRAILLQCARSLTGSAGAGEPGLGRAATPAASALLPVISGRALSDREREVARLVVAGQTYREIGGRLFISAKTVEHHVSRIRHRLGVSNRSELLARLRAELAASA